MTAAEYPDFKNHTSLNMSSSCTDVNCIIYSVANVIIFVLGVAGNGLVIWIAGFKMKKSVIATWYLSLAVSDFIMCSTLPFGVVQKVTNEWIFGRFMCKFRYFIKLLNMYSSIFLLVIISVDRCVVVMFPVWARNKRTIRKAVVTVILTWIVSAALSSPAAIFRDIQDKQKTQCKRTGINEQSHFAIVYCRFIFGFVIPFLIIVICYVIIMRKLKFNQMATSKKPFKIMTLLIAAFLICWLPFHLYSLLRIRYKEFNFVKILDLFGVILANANSCLNPILYAFMGRDFKRQCYAVLSNIENAIEEEEEGQEGVQGTVVNTDEESISSAI
ncbi:C3a anaphylatoxin chemotactic receptor-like [Colossoma macropomum]|uniref:C3a anaphylatoxin chemotactic receptor-like n=1 Tax=Colossoma macropomum TaxID=42526 RepID=UPI0018644EC7|nr:C3a anaphylatoxin chemotactic receptor-like [Colossoma macropomum]XP_036455112.1 C3a anaphylatoxin chemotactic receptor-like [Colossoma macropomum]